VLVIPALVVLYGLRPTIHNLGTPTPQALPLEREI
jgi:hypothetical protein